MVYAMQHGLEHIRENTQMLKPGVNIQDLSRNCHRLDECDEWPLVAYPDHMVEGAFDYPLEAGMVLCVEALVSPEGGDFSIKLEEQVLITETGHDVMSQYPFDSRLLGDA